MRRCGRMGIPECAFRTGFAARAHRQRRAPGFLPVPGRVSDLAAPYPAAVVGVAVDTFHVWWDPQLRDAIARAGREDRIASYQVCDFNLPIASDALLSRGMMGDGVIDFARITGWVAGAGYRGDIEVEIFNREIWDAPSDQLLETVKERYASLVLPFA